MVRRQAIRRARKVKGERASDAAQEAISRLRHGTEPVLTGHHDSRSLDLADCYNWHTLWYRTDSHRLDLKAETADVWIDGQAKAGKAYTKDQARAFKSAKYCPITVIVNCKLMNQGVTLSPDIMDRHNREVRKVIALAKPEDEAAPDSEPAPSIRDRVAEKATEFRADFWFWFDSWPNLDGGAYDFLRKNDVKPYAVKGILEKLRALQAEVTEAAKWKDADLKQAYRHLGKKLINTFAHFVDQTVGDVERFQSNKKSTRAPRRKKVRSASQLVTRIKYQKEDASLKLVSVDPTQVIGARELWVYNTRYKQLSRYVSSSSEGLSLRGTTLDRFDPETSVRKTLRKPEVILESVLKGTPSRLPKVMAELKTAEYRPNGRINEQTVLLRAVK